MTATAAWPAPGWEAGALAWSAAQLAARGVRITGAAVTVRAHAWSIVLQLPTTAGPVYCKACAPAMAAEMRLLPRLAAWSPALLPPVLSVDEAAGWLLLSDGGDLLRPIIKADRDLDHWRQILAGYAALQRSLLPMREELLGLGVWDRTLAALPGEYAGLLADTDALLIDKPDGLRAEEHGQLLALAPRFAADCADLAALGIPASIDHSDLHDGNVLLCDGRYVLIDWGDACVGHPFMTLPITLRSIAYHLELAAEDRALADLRDGYLAAWSDYAPLPALRAAFERARRISMVNRALTWRAALRQATPAQRATDAGAVPGWLQEYLAAADKP